MGLFRTRQPFLQNNAWQNQALNSLVYNTSQAGSVVPLVYGTVRQPVNLIAYDGFTSTDSGGGKKGGGGKGSVIGGGGKGGKGGSGQTMFSVDVDFALCEGPVSITPSNQVFSSAGVEPFNSASLTFYSGTDGQAPDGTFVSFGAVVGYSGTCHVTATPLLLGTSPVVPNISIEINGFQYTTGGPLFPLDANPANVLIDFLTDSRHGAGFPSANLDNLLATNNYGAYCQSAGLLISAILDGQQRALEWLDGLAKLTNTAVVWSDILLKMIPYGDEPLASNGATWTPNLTPVYLLTDQVFVTNAREGGDPPIGEDDPILVTRTNPADAVNWLSIQYTERSNYYNGTIITAFDQGAIDQFGLRTGDNLQGKMFANSTSAQISAQLVMQRLQYIRNTPYKFQLGWQFGLLEPMDIVVLTGSLGDLYLQYQPVRILSITEDESGIFTVEAEEFPALALS